MLKCEFVLFKDFTDRYGTAYLKNQFVCRYFGRTLLIDLKIATYLKSGCLKSILEGFCSKGDYLKGGHKYPQQSMDVFCLKLAVDLTRTVSN